MIFKKLTRITFFRKMSGSVADIFEGTNINRNIRIPVELPRPLYGGRHLVSMIPGEHPGPILMDYVREIFCEAHVPVDFDIMDEDDWKNDVQSVQNAIASIKRNRVAIMGHVEDHGNANTYCPNVLLRTGLDLYVSVVHCKTYANIKCKYPVLDIVIFRQNTEGEYAMLEHESKRGVVESLKVITRDNTERLANWGFEYAKRKGRKNITVAHKANIMKLVDGLFLDTVNKVAECYPEIKVNDKMIGSCCTEIVQNPHNFDIIMLPNLYGNVVVHILCGLTGGVGLLSAQSYGQCCAVFETAGRLNYPKINDEVIINPISMLNASIDMLYHLRRNEHAELIQNAICKTVAVDQIQTEDMGGCNTSDEMVESIIKYIKCGDLDE